jgi:hypothetical protein
MFLVINLRQGLQAKFSKMYLQVVLATGMQNAIPCVQISSENKIKQFNPIFY